METLNRMVPDENQFWWSDTVYCSIVIKLSCFEVVLYTKIASNVRFIKMAKL